MVRERRALELAFHVYQAHWLWYVTCVCIYKANILISAHVLSQFGSKLQVEGEVDQIIGWEFIFIRVGRRQTQPDGNCAQDVPGNAVVFTVWISITNKKDGFQRELRLIPFKGLTQRTIRIDEIDLDGHLSNSVCGAR